MAFGPNAHAMHGSQFFMNEDDNPLSPYEERVPSSVATRPKIGNLTEFTRGSAGRESE